MFKKSMYKCKEPNLQVNKFSKKQKTMQIKNNIDKRKSDDICFNNFLNNFKTSHKMSEIPVDHRLSYQDKNILISSLMKQNANNDEKAVVKDKNYYLNFLNNVYLNDSHLTNQNVIKKNLKESSGILKTLQKKKTFNFSKATNSKDTYQKKLSFKITNKKNSCCSNDMNNISKKKISISTVNDIKNQSNQSNRNLTSSIEQKIIDNKNKILSEKIVSKYQSTKKISKLKNDEIISNRKKYKSSRNISKNKEKEKDYNINLKEEKNENNESMQKDIKIITINQKNKNRRKSNHNLEIEIEKCETKINANKNENDGKSAQIIKVNEKNNKNKIKENCKSCLFCCFTSKDDSFFNE